MTYFGRSELYELYGMVTELCGAEDRYTHHLAADIWGNPIDVRNPNAKRFDLSGALIAAVDRLCDPQDDRRRLQKLETSKIESKRVHARRLLHRRAEHAKVLYGYGWQGLDQASEEITGKGLWEPKSFQTAMDVLARCKLTLCEELGIKTRDSGLGLCRPSDPYAVEEVKLMTKIERGGEAGYTIASGEELLASYDLYRRGLIVEVWPTPWTYRRRVLY